MIQDNLADDSRRGFWYAVSTSLGVPGGNILEGRTINDLHPLRQPTRETITSIFDELARLQRYESVVANLLSYCQRTPTMSPTPLHQNLTGTPAWQLQNYSSFLKGSTSSLFAQWMLREIQFQIETQLAILYAVWSRRTDLTTAPNNWSQATLSSANILELDPSKNKFP